MVAHPHWWCMQSVQKKLTKARDLICFGLSFAQA
jgi:hypothetical protein